MRRPMSKRCSRGIQWTRLPQCEWMESRRLLSTLAWTNRGEFDGFDGVFGGNAGVARAVVDAVLNLYGQIIVDLNNNHANRLDLAITMNASGTGHGGSGGPSLWSASGVPQAGSIYLGRGNDTTGDGLGDGGGYYLDPVPTDSAEFSVVGNAFVAGAPVGSPLQSLADFYNLVAHEVGHVIGFGVGNSSGRFKSLTTYTGFNDTVGYFYTFNGPSIRHLLTSANGGSDGGSAIHSARADVTPIYFGGTRFDGCYDLMNWFYVDGARRMINDSMLLMLKDAYGYAINLPQKFGTYYAMLNRSTGELVVNGGAGRSADTIVIDRYSDRLRVSVDLGNDIPATGALPGNEPLPAFVSDWQVGEVSSVRIEAGDGNDSITIRDLGYSVGTNGFFRVPITVNGGAGTDSLVIDDPLNRDGAGGGIRWGIDQNRVQDYWGGYPANGHADYDAVENLTINGGSLKTWFAVDGLDAGVSLQLFGNDGDDELLLGQASWDLAGSIHGDVYFNGGDRLDVVRVYDQNATASPNVYTFNSFIADLFDKTGGSGSFGLLATAFHEGFELRSGWASDRFEVNALTWSSVTIHAGAGDDSLNLGDGRLESLADTVHFIGGPGINTVEVDDSSEPAGGRYYMSHDRVYRNGIVVVLDSDIELHRLWSSQGNDTVDVQSNAIYAYEVDTGSGDDLVRLDADGTWTSNVTLMAGPGDDLLTIDDSATFGDYDYEITNSMVTDGVIVAQIDYELERLLLTTGSGSNRIDAELDYHGLAATLHAGGGDDEVRISPVSGIWYSDFVVHGGDGYDRLSINDSGLQASVSVAYSIQTGIVTDSFGYRIDHAQIESVSLACGSGDDTVNVFMDVPGLHLEINVNTGAGVDSVEIDGTIPGSPVFVQTGDEADYLTVNNDSIATAEAVLSGPDQFHNVRAGAGGWITLAPGGSNWILVTGRLSGPFDTGLARLDLKDNALVLDNGQEQNLSYIRAALQVGYSGGAWWGAGFCSSTALLSLQGDGVGHASGFDLFGSAGGWWRGLQVTRFAQLMAFTLNGDTDLDADVDFADLLRLAQHYGHSTTGRWFTGDFTYDATVDFADLLGLAQNYGVARSRRGHLSELLAA